MNKYITIAVYTYPHECMVIKHIFDQEDIRYYLINETLVGLLPLSSYAFGGLQLKVHKQDFSRAQLILQKHSDSSSHLRIV